MKKTTLANEILVATLSNGGYTYKNDKEGRYSVSNGRCTTVKLYDIIEVQDEVRLILQYWISLEVPFGTWIDKSTSILYIDGIDLYDSLNEAMKQGRKLGEIAIYDLKENKEVFL